MRQTTQSTASQATTKSHAFGLQHHHFRVNLRQHSLAWYAQGPACLSVTT